MKRKREYFVPEKVSERRIRVHNRREPEFHFFQYWRVVRKYMYKRYNLKQNDLDMLFFLHPKGLFSIEDAKDFSDTYAWDKERWRKLMKEGYIHLWRERRPGTGEKNLYELTIKSKKLVTKAYAYLSGDKPIPEDPQSNPLFGKTASFSDRRLKFAIKAMNKDIKKRKLNQ